jgi:predicted alpha/beta superfamily hydrolase
MTPAFHVSSPETGTTYSIYVESPTGDQAGANLAPMVFLDADDQFQTAVAAYRQLRATNAVRPLLLVGVGYGASYSKPGNHRGRDYTPVNHSDEPSSGGADTFLRFLTTTFWTQLQERYAIRNDVRGIGGHSLGALLAVYALLQPKPFFTHFLASAPSLWWADRAILEQAKRTRDAISVLPAKLFLGLGERDSKSMTGDLALLEHQLAERPFDGLVVESKRFPRKNHFNVLPEAFSAGLSYLFPAAVESRDR